jgi:predicted MFS family arabinose efflux permease
MKNKTIVASFILVVTVCISMFLYFGFKDAYLVNTSKTDQITMEFLESEIEYFLELGIDLDKYYDLDKIIEKFNETYEHGDGITLLDIQGSIMYSTGNNVLDDYTFLVNEGIDNYKYVINEGRFLSVTVLDDGEVEKGYLISSIKQSTINRAAYLYLLKAILIYVIVGFLYMLFVRKKALKENFVKHVILLQILASVIRLYFYYTDIKNNMLLQVGNALNILMNKLTIITKYNVPISNISGLDTFIKGIANRIEFIDTIKLESINGSQGFDFTYDISRQYVFKLLGSSALDTMILMILVTFLLLEIVNMHTVIDSKKGSHSIESMRGFGFIYFLGYYMSIIFVPIRMMELLKEGSYILPTEIMIALPVSLEAITVAITAVAIIKTIEKIGFKDAFIFGCGINMLGLYLSYLANNPYVFICARMVMGFGVGISIMTLRSYVVSNPDSTKINESVTAFNVGVFSSLNIGCVIGAIVGQYFGLQYSFILSGIMMAIAALSASKFISHSIVPKKSNTKFILDFISIVKDKKLVLGLILFLLPIRILTGYSDYFFPVIASKNLGWSLSDISRGYLLNSMIIILIGVNITRFIGKKFNVQKRLYLGIMIMMSGVLVMAILNNSIGMITSIIIAAFALAFVEGNFLEYYSSFKCIENMGSIKAMSFYTLFDKGILYVIPYVYALILANNIKISLIIFLGGITVILVIGTIILKKQNDLQGLVKNE